MSKKASRQSWFRAVRGSYIPKAWQGWLVYIPLIFLAVCVWLAAYWSQAGIIERLLSVLTELVAIGIVFHWIAKRL